jgi:hypothetical protein
LARSFRARAPPTLPVIPVIACMMTLRGLVIDRVRFRLGRHGEPRSNASKRATDDFGRPISEGHIAFPPGSEASALKSNLW